MSANGDPPAHPKATPAIAQSGYTLPVFACAAAVAALTHLQDQSRPSVSQGGPTPNPSRDQPTPSPSREGDQINPKSKIQNPKSVVVDLIHPNKIVEIPIEQVACLDDRSAMAIARSDPGDNLDLTRNTPIWAWVRWGTPGQQPAIQINGGEGIGRHMDANSSKAAIYSYATQLLETNLSRVLKASPESGPSSLIVTIILPEGRALATRTSNAAFGVVEGLSLLGTSGIAQPLSAPSQLESFRETLQDRITQYPTVKNCLVYCIGENGLDLARRGGIPDYHLIKTANWIGPLLVEGAMQGAQAILLLGYHGKLIKLAGGIFHTHHHLADGRLDIFIAQCALLGLETRDIQALGRCETTEAALGYLRSLDRDTGSNWEALVYAAIAQRIEQKAQAYIYAHSQQHITVGTGLFGRDRHMICWSETGERLSNQMGTQFYSIHP